MLIIGMTTSAAAQVLLILLGAHLRPLRDFEIHPELATTPPITFTMLGTLTVAQVTKIRVVADTMVIG